METPVICEVPTKHSLKWSFGCRKWGKQDCAEKLNWDAVTTKTSEDPLGSSEADLPYRDILSQTRGLDLRAPH